MARTPVPTENSFVGPGYRRLRLGIFLPAALLLGACGPADTAGQIGTQRWGNFDVAVELRPSPPREGHNEVVVIVSGERHRPVYDALVFVRSEKEQPWVQAIQDGHVGVYRRAVLFRHRADPALQVRLQRGDDQAELVFPLHFAAASP